MITKTLVQEKDRLEFLPKYIGNRFFKFEMLVYAFTDKFCKDYSGGYWEFWMLENGGILMTLDSDEVFQVCNDMNYFEDTMSAESISIAVNMFALNALMDGGCDKRIIDYYYALGDYASEQKEASKIIRLID
ncbi:MAG: antirestriction protein [Cellvibrionaceae bacterium]